MNKSHVQPREHPSLQTTWGSRAHCWMEQLHQVCEQGTPALLQAEANVWEGELKCMESPIR